MDKLPIEIQSDIFVLLHQTEKVECMKVCRAWKSTIKSCCLFDTIIITSRAQLNILKETLKRDPQLGEPTKRFFAFLDNTNDPDIAGVLSYFPVLQEVCVPTANFSKKQIRRSAYKNSEKYIEHLSEYSGGTMVTLSIKYNVYHRLKTIKIRKCDDHFSIHELFSSFVNAPVLKEIRLEKCSISINNLETLHKSAPSLESAYFSNTSIIAHTTDFFEESLHMLDYKPVTLMSTFSLAFFMGESEIRDIAQFIRYIERRYTNLTELEFNYINEEEEEEGEREARIDRKKMIYTDILKPFYQKLGPQLKRLSTFTVDEAQIFFDWMECFGYQVQNLNLEVSSINWKLYRTKSLNQLKYVKKLTLDNLFCDTFDWLGDCIVLEELKLSFRDSQVSNSRTQMITLSSIIHVLPQTVSTIFLASVQLQDESLTYQLPSVKSLEFRRVTMSQSTDSLISIAFPGLQTLRLTYCGTSNKHFVFPGLRLSRLHIEDRYSKKKKLYIALLVKTTNDNEQRLYKQAKHRVGGYCPSDYLPNFDAIVYPRLNHISYTTATREPIVSVTCASVKDVLF